MAFTEPAMADMYTAQLPTAFGMFEPTLPKNQQVSMGMELLSMLREQSPLDCDSARADLECEKDVDVEVIVKNGFIEVVDPQFRPKMQRSMSDSALLDFASESQKPWKKLASEKWLQDLSWSDASTTISGDGPEGEGCELAYGERRRDRHDTCWSDDESPEMMQSYMPYDYCDSWWMPMAVEAGTTMLYQMPDGSMCPVDMSAQWVEQGAECEGGQAHASDQEWRTTVMLRNMPNNYTRDMLREWVDSMGFAGCYDFAYLPVDFKSQAGLGYAFINFVSSAEAQRCFDNFEGFSEWKVPSEKVCTVTWGSPYQGLEAHIERYQNSPVMHHSIPDEWKPVLIDQGVRIAFPAPTKPIKTPKVRQQPTGTN